MLLAALALGSLAGPTAAAEEPDLAALGDGHFAKLFGFGAYEAYESSRGTHRVEFVVMRRWVEGEAQILIDVRDPPDFEQVALRLDAKTDRSDDLFAYNPFERKVLRMVPDQLGGPILSLIAIADQRPISPGELRYERLPDEEVEGEPCTVLVGRPSNDTIGFESVELAISQKSGFSLRSRYLRGKRVLRTVTIRPRDLRVFGERRLPGRRSIVIGRDRDPIQLDLRQFVESPDLSDKLFSQHNLSVQRFPSF